MSLNIVVSLGKVNKKMVIKQTKSFDMLWEYEWGYRNSENIHKYWVSDAGDQLWIFLQVNW